MRRIPSWGLILGVVLVAVVLGGGIGWWVSRPDGPAQATSPIVATPEETHKTEIPVAVATSANSTEATKPAAARTNATPQPDRGTASASDGLWQTQLDEVLSSEGEPEQKAERLLKMLPHLTEDAQVEVSQHLVNFITDENYLPLAQIVTNATTPEAVSTVFMTDLLNRNDGLKLPLLLAMARDEAHPKHQDAKELLELYLQENHGNDWEKWQTSVTNWLAQNGPDFTLQAPPEPAPDPAP